MPEQNTSYNYNDVYYNYTHNDLKFITSNNFTTSNTSSYKPVTTNLYTWANVSMQTSAFDKKKFYEKILEKRKNDLLVINDSLKTKTINSGAIVKLTIDDQKHIIEIKNSKNEMLTEDIEFLEKIGYTILFKISDFSEEVLKIKERFLGNFR
jgi:hypothetical protein